MLKNISLIYGIKKWNFKIKKNIDNFHKRKETKKANANLFYGKFDVCHDKNNIFMTQWFYWTIFDIFLITLRI